MHATRIIGIAFMLFGLLLFSNLLPLITGIVDTTPPSITRLGFAHGTFDKPTGGTSLSTDPGEPGMLYPGVKGELYAIIYEENPKTVTISISNLGTYQMTLFSRLGEICRYVIGWTTPSSGSFIFAVVAEDEVGHKTSKSFYGEVGNVKGYFTINGITITSTEDVVYLRSRTLNFEFIATESGNLIQRVGIYIADDKGQPVGIFDPSGNAVYMSETVTDQKWTQTFTVSKDGKYNIEGRVWTTAQDSLLFMSIGIDTGMPPILPFTLIQWMGLILIFVGMGLTVRKVED